MKLHKQTIIAIALLAATLAFAGNRLNAQWEELFNGKNLDGWEVKNGQQKFEAKDGVIVGTSVVGEPNGFLCTKTPTATLFWSSNSWPTKK